MAEERKSLEPRSEEIMVREVADRERRKLRASQAPRESIWFGLGLFGMVGWSVALPTVLMTALGIYIDRRFADRFSWTLMLLVAGVALGCLHAWYWVSSERNNIEQNGQGEEGRARR